MTDLEGTGIVTQTRSCGCPSEEAPRGLSRRTFLRAAAATGALAGLGAPMLSTRLAYAANGASYTGDVLVVVSLRGGFDGLSAVVPAGETAYYSARPDVAVPASLLLARDQMFGLHPALSPLLPYWQAGTFGAVHAVGQADPTRSHFEALEEMERAAPGTSLRSGWLDRMLGVRGAGTTFQAAQVGSTMAALSLSGPAPELAMRDVDGFALSGGNGEVNARLTAALRAAYASAPPAQAAPAISALGALATTAKLAASKYVPANGAAYPDTPLAKAMRDVARLVKAGVGLQVACVDYGDWDFHENLGAPRTGGLLNDHLTVLAGALAAFATDLGTAMSGVTVATLSEFGRRLAQNGTGGTDHGHGNAVLLLGGGVLGGRVHGRWPGLGAAQLDQGDLRGLTDYRTVLGEVLQKRCGAGSLATVFPGFTMPSPLGIVRSRT